ncbi:MAG TPA: hypothetical protein VN672_12320 [Solirubrobacteraceae bacterium]|nr:hypothetical protein [Solirubrobacteraceae bacterium]
MGVATPAPAPPVSAAAQAHGGGTVVLAFVPAGERAIASVPGMSVGILSATQGACERGQLLLDIGQGARIASSAYRPSRPPPLTLRAGGRAGAGQLAGWSAVLRRAEDAPQLLQPGLLVSSLAMGAGYVAVAGSGALDAPAAADRAGRVASVSLGPPATLGERIAAARAKRRLVVADLPGGAAGIAEMNALARSRARGDLLLALQRAPNGQGHELLWIGVAGLPGGGGRELTSATTSQRGLVSAVDVAPTILAHLGVAVPDEMRGERIETDGRLDSAGLRSLMARLHVVGGRRLKALGVLLGAWAVLLLAAGLLSRLARGRTSAARAGAVRAWSLRVGALAVLWVPTAVLVSAAIEPGAAVEYATIALLCLLLAAISDALLPWPRAPVAPATVAVLALVIDALAGTQLLMRSLLGPNPILGARFYGFGNDLKSGLAVLALAAVAAALYPSARSRRSALAMAGVGIALAVIVGAARIGAGVGGVILVSAGFAVATIELLPGGFSRRRVLLVVCAPVLALVLLAAIDLLTAHGSGHYTGSILHARSAGDLRDVLVRRYGAAWRELKNHAMPAATVLAVLCALAAVRWRERLLAPVGEDPAWLAALAGGLAAGVVGTLSEDSGPVLLVVAVFALGCVCSYLWGRPPSRAAAPYRPTASTTIAVDAGSEGIA